MIACHRLLLVPALAMLPNPAAANEAEDDAGPAIVVSGIRTDEPAATKTDTPLLNTPQSIAVLDREQLDDQGMEQLGDALRYVPGVTIGQGEGHRDQIILRGQASTADFFLDGLRDDAQYYRPLYNTQQVEVLKGANALLFGRGGGGGIVNRVSKAPVLGEARIGAAAGIDIYGAWSVAGDANLPLGDSAALRLNATYEAFANHRDAFEGHFVGVAPTLAYEPADGTRLTLAYEYDHDDRVIDRGVPSVAGLPIQGYDKAFFGSATLNRGTVDAHLTRVRLDQDLAEGLTLDLNGEYAFYDKYYANVLPASATATTVTLSGYDSANRRSNWIGQANLVWKGRTGPLGHTLLAGIELGDQTSDALSHNVLFAPGNSLTTTVALAQSLVLPATIWSAPRSASHSKVQTRSYYLQDQVDFAPWLQIIAGVRRDRFAIDATNNLTALKTASVDANWSPRLGLVIKPQDSVSLYASFAKSFLPQTGDQFSTLDPTYQTLDPETFRNLEIGVKWNVTPAFAMTAAAFQVDRSNTRVADPANPGFWVLTGSSRVKGFEVSAGGKLASAWQMSLAYTYQQGEIRSTTSAASAGRQLDKLPRHQASAWTRYDLSPRFGLGVGVVHQSSQFAAISNAVRLPAFTRVDAAAYFNLTHRLALQLNVENLTNARYFASAHTDNNIQPGEPINARVSARLKF